MNTHGEEAARLVDMQHRALAASLNGIERRVAALESYADQVKEADTRYAELQQVQQLDADSEALLDLLARTASDDLAIAGINSLTTEAAALATAFSTALESAKVAAVAALPGHAAA